VSSKFLNRGKVIALLTERTKKLLAEREEVLKVMLFGSIAQGRQIPGSDADLLIEISYTNESHWFRRGSEYIDCFLNELVPVELFIYTSEELRRMTAGNNSFIKRILQTGIRLS